MIVDPYMDVYTKTRHHRKTLQQTQKTTTCWKPKEY